MCGAINSAILVATASVSKKLVLHGTITIITVTIPCGAVLLGMYAVARDYEYHHIKQQATGVTECTPHQPEARRLRPRQRKQSLVRSKHTVLSFPTKPSKTMYLEKALWFSDQIELHALPWS